MNYYSQSELNDLLKESFDFGKIDEYLLSSIDSELNSFLIQLKHPNAPIYIGWIEQWKEIEEILTDGSTSISFNDYLKLQGHVLFPEFCQFVTPLLFPFLFRQSEQGILNETLEYIVLLQSDSRAIVENSVFSQIKQLLNQTKELQEQTTVTEDQLIESVHDIINEQVIRILNSFSKRSYVHVVEYVNDCFLILKSKGCTVRMANWIVKQLQQLNLNPEHLQQLTEFQSDLKAGVFYVENKGRKQNKSTIVSFIPTIGIIIFVGLVIWLIVAKPWSDSISPQEHEMASSFTEFTVEERKHIDSLVKIIQPEPVLNLEIDDVYIEGRELMVDARKTLTNDSVNHFYKSWEEYLISDSIHSQEECKQLAKKIKISSLPSGFSKLTDKKTGKPAFFRNESEYTIQIVVFNNSRGSKPYYQELKRDEQIEFNLAVGEHIGVVAGNYAIPYQSTNESIVFCEFDNTTVNSLLTMYVLKKSNSFNYKFLVTGTDVYDFQLVDMYGVLEVYR
jgi:DNA replication initiation complex subunit (GINS family)